LIGVASERLTKSFPRPNRVHTAEGNNTSVLLYHGRGSAMEGRSVQGRLALAIAAGLALVAGIAAGAGDSGGAARAAVAPQRPNIVVLETDDQTLAEMEVLPNVRSLIGDQGVTFDNNFDSFSLCCPSRATFLTGQYSHNNGVRGNSPPQGGYQALDKSNTLVQWLQSADYYTVHLGKFLNGYGRQNPTEVPPGWSEWHGAVDPTTYRFYGYTLNEGGTLHTFCATPQPSCYQTDVYRDKANEIIRRRAPQGPFFLWVAFLGDHSGAPREPDDPRNLGTPVPAPRHKDALKGTPLPQPPSFNEADVSDKPQIIKGRPLLNAGRIAAIQENWQQRRETLMSVDEAVASIVETLRQTGELDNTLIIFTSDNGFFHGEHRVQNGKVLWYEPSIHLPLLMRWTGNKSLPRGVHRQQLAMNVDDAETILAAAGDTARPGRVEDGVSLLRFWRDGGLQLGRDLLIDNSPGAGHFDGIRTLHYKYAEYANGDRELYDLRKDPFELQSQHANPAYDALEASLAVRLHSLVSCAGASCRTRPSVRLTAGRSGRCGVVTAAVGGKAVESATFLVNGSRVLTDLRPPFRAKLRFKKRSVVRARVTLAFDRLVTLDGVVRGCT
jgi:N-acetylglucosamine-6-sulfatase